MVELATIQTVYYIVAAVGILVASINYVRVSLEDARKKRIDTTNDLMQIFTSKEGVRSYLELLNMSWKDYDDFERKYGTDANFENAVTRVNIWFTYDSLGHLLRKGLIDLETVYDSAGVFTLWTWDKFEPILDEHRRRYVGNDVYRGWEYLAGEVMKMKLKRDPSYKVPEMFAKYIPNK